MEGLIWFQRNSFCWWVLVAVIGGLVVACLWFFIKWIGCRFRNLIRQNQQRKDKAYELIKNWYVYAERNQNKADQKELNHLESEVDSFFRQERNRNLTLRFDKKFRKSVLKGFKEELRDNLRLFLRYARLHHKNMVEALQLHELAAKGDPIPNLRRFPFQFYWDVIRVNFWIYYGQSRQDWKDTSEEERRYWGDVEIPFRILRRCFKD